MQRLLAVVAIVTATLASAQVYPGATPISWVVPFPAGGPTDRVAHDLADAMRKTLGGANFVIDNANGAVVVTDQHMEPAGHKAFVAAEIAKFKPVIEAAGRFADRAALPRGPPQCQTR